MITAENKLSGEFIEEIRQRLSQNKQVRRTLPDHGRLHIDRKLPFLIVYRRPFSHSDAGTDQLVKGEASYLIASCSQGFRSGVAALIRSVVKTLSTDPKAFLIIELWSKLDGVTIIDPEMGKRSGPEFRILVPYNRIPSETVESLRKELSRVFVSRIRGRVTTDYNHRPWPAGFPPLMSTSDISDFNCFILGLEIAAIYRDPDTGDIYPLVLKKIHRGLSRALKKAAFEFSQKRTTYSQPNYKSLGRRAVVKAVWEVDERLAEISNQIDFLLMVTPVNIEQSFRRFCVDRFEKEPVYYYRPIPVDPSVLKRKLYDIPFDRIEDPVLSSIFHKKLIELERKLSMLRDRKTRNFLYGSMQLYGDINDNLLSLASDILEKIPRRSRELKSERRLDAKEFAVLARQELEIYRKTFPSLASKVQIREDITGLMVSNGNLFIGNKVSIAGSRAKALVQHEVGTHILTYLNGREQPFQQLYTGLAGCDELQEGLAVLAEYLVGGLSPPRLRLLAGRVVAARMLIHGASFVDTFRVLYREIGFNKRTSYIITSRIYRSGGFTKDAIYLRGLVSLVEYLRKGGTITPLMIGKISIEDIPIVTELQFRKVLHPVRLYPEYLNSESSLGSLEDLRNGTKILKLI
jgi:uncharacterized protein (TIGR02421 family)